MKAIIFDMGGVLIDLDLDGCRKAFKDGLGFMEIDDILDACHQKGIFGAMEEGLVSGDEFRDYVISHSRESVTREDVDKALSRILVGIEPYKADMLRRLSADYELYMLSNNNPVALPFASEMFRKAGFNMQTGFRKCYISYQMKMLKPSEAFYKAVIEDISLPPSEMLFIDDSPRNVEAAIAAGLPAIHYRPGENLDALLSKALSA